MECNPGTIDEKKLLAMKESGVNRLSIGLQAVQNHHLKYIGRIHTYEEFEKNYIEAKNIGFNNINIDLMYALPNQTVEDWKETSKLLSIRAEIFCERASHKPIIIGKGGATLKRVGEMARQDLEAFFGIKVFLDLWVKVKENWRASEMAVSNMGFKREDF